MSSIRLTYSGLISFLVLMISIVTGMIFTLIVTRRLDQTDFALWSLIGGIVAYSLVFGPVSNYWVSRHIARGEKEAGTGIISSLFFSAGGIVIYLIAIFFISKTSDSNYDILFLAIFLIPFSYLLSSFTAISGSHKPQGNAFAMLISEGTKIPVGFVLVYVADLGIAGAIATSIAANSAMIIFYVIYLREKLTNSFHKYTFKNWIKLSWIPIIAGLHDRLIHLDTTVFTVITGSVLGVSYIGIARVIGNLVSNASSISVGLSPKLLATEKSEHIQVMLGRTLLFAIPMLGFVIVFAKSGLWILNPIYVEGVLIVHLWATIHFIYVIYGIFYSGLMGLERVDVGFNAKLKSYVKSRLFTVPLVYLIGYSSYIITLMLLFWQATENYYQILDTIAIWGLVGIIVNIGILISFWIMINKTITIKIPIQKIIKYTVFTLISSVITFSIMSEYLEYHESVYDFIPALIPYLLIYICMYFGILYTSDKETRDLFNQIIKEIKK